MKDGSISWSSTLFVGLAALGLYEQLESVESAPTWVLYDLTALHVASGILVNPHKG